MSKTTAFATTVCLIAVSLGGASAGGGTIRFRERAVVGDTLIRLKDIARVLETDESLRRQLEEIVIGPAPVPGRTTKLDFSEIRSRLQAMGVDLSRIRFSGRSRVLVTRSEKTGAVKRAAFSEDRSQRGAERRRERAERILSVAVQRHLEKVAPQVGQVSVSIRLRTEDIPVILAGSDVPPAIRGITQPLQRAQLLKADFYAANGETVTVPFECRIVPKPFVLAARYTISRGDLIQAADLTWKQVSAAEEGFTDPEMVIGREARRTIARGKVLSRADIQQVPLIRPNDIVTVYSRRPGITIKREMKARTGGALGETVTLVELKGRQSVTARVIGLHKAEVLSGGISLRTAPAAETGAIVFRRLAKFEHPRAGRSQTGLTRAGAAQQSVREPQAGSPLPAGVGFRQPNAVVPVQKYRVPAVPANGGKRRTK